MDLDQIETFLVLAEELHFGRASERLHVSQPMVSRRLTAFEAQIGGALFERTSRRVRLTPLGEELYSALAPAHRQLTSAIGHARTVATGVTGELRLGCVVTAPSEPLAMLLEAFETQHPECKVTLREHLIVGDEWDIFGPLRRGESDAPVLLQRNQRPGPHGRASRVPRLPGAPGRPQPSTCHAANGIRQRIGHRAARRKAGRSSRLGHGTHQPLPRGSVNN